MSVSEIRIREANERDREAIQTLLLEAYGQYEAVFPAGGWDAYKASILASVDGEGPKARIIVEFEGEIVGSSLLFLSSEVAYGLPELEIHSPIIRLIAVSPKVRGRGIATELIKESARRALELGAATLHLHTSDMMASAVKLYEYLGFERAFDKDIQKGETLVKSYRLNLKETAILSS
ncbi:GNAT family N-acetyltransferase [Paenibacillus sp. SYP-B3998]|uniref:GNAT family N-acetyltransferase n=1 Tax=Paenibacillus sp. SYP-B3998 TaxID=2678564 RepID=A0A6G4A1V9_9BACL|nr:GNAT family N-acetyltransferase [Paenibacillus sp. SYP-B3998]NEW08372.1 GNAT family N-acetyltransferase [Paenibacillus sp. SYP-B3998]